MRATLARGQHLDAARPAMWMYPSLFGPLPCGTTPRVKLALKRTRVERVLKILLRTDASLGGDRPWVGGGWRAGKRWGGLPELVGGKGDRICGGERRSPQRRLKTLELVVSHIGRLSV